MKISRENRIMQALLVICVAAGFACFALIVLPDQLAKAGIVVKTPLSNGPSNLSELVPTIKEKTAAKKPLEMHGGTIARFVPEGLDGQSSFPLTPSDSLSASDAYDPAPDAAGGAGAAIEGDSFEAWEARGPDGTYDALQTRTNAVPTADAELATGHPYGDGSGANAGTYLSPEGTPLDVKFQMSSLARGDPATVDSQRGRRMKPWLLPPEGFEQDVAFWQDIYAKYDRNNVVLHHPRYLGIVYDVVNLSDIDSDPRLTGIEKGYAKEKRVENHRKSVEDALAVLATNPPASSLTHEQWRIRQLFEGINESDKFRRAAMEDGVRAQLGQRDKFMHGLAESGTYLGEIESIFESYALPKELTRLIFVESMFNTRAVSSAGASGIWQFMPDTGRLYLSMTSFADERNDPLKATHAAARLLRHNYEALGTWPLAINAYNAGRGRLKQAMTQLGTSDIGTIMRQFKHKAYGFASRNFYLEFLAAYEVAEHAERYFGRIEHAKPLECDVVKSNYHLSLPHVANLAGISMEELHELNPSFSSKVLSGDPLLPRRTEIRVPHKRGDLFLASAARAPKSRTGSLHHVVRKGETISSIAAAYGVTPTAIRKSNDSIGRNLYDGQKLLIPAEDKGL